ncbi:unnamed protein product [Bursaphelenchus xylophilus]|uniref:(pine wood nematode) hypothetical protein n=1 Tax=Bursaphelenchus xylophilus TaxID=6326 RepID=A0A7I8WQN4_BURXY|nr:unnamed protein product [Bursaphelenchus xylophilus]CAG9097064.1 unnamed protein product [Bursaphelenchus xylophilus]
MELQRQSKLNSIPRVIDKADDRFSSHARFPQTRLERLTAQEINRLNSLPSNLRRTGNETQDERDIKNVLSSIVQEVVQKDNENGWHKSILNKLHATKYSYITTTNRVIPSEPVMQSPYYSQSPPQTVRRYFTMRQIEEEVQPHVERLKLEINKRRYRFEIECANQLGLATPWKRTRYRRPDEGEDNTVLSLPAFPTADDDFRHFGYLLDAIPTSNCEEFAPSTPSITRTNSASSEASGASSMNALYPRTKTVSLSSCDIPMTNLCIDSGCSSPCSGYSSDCGRLSLMEVSDDEEEAYQDSDFRSKAKPKLPVDNDEPIAKRTRLHERQMLMEEEYQREKVMVNPLEISLHPDGPPMSNVKSEMIDEKAEYDGEEVRQSMSPGRSMFDQSSLSLFDVSKGDEGEKKELTKKLVKVEHKNPRGRPRKKENSTETAEVKKPKKIKKELINLTSGERKRKLLCSKCVKVCDERRYYAQCPACDQRVHGKCIGLTEKRVRKMGGWMCEECDAPPKEVVYCLCKKPYDESLFYVGCDGCEDWFHPECVGTTQKEVESTNAGYLCPTCSADNQVVQTVRNQKAAASEASMEQRMASRKEFPLLWRLLDVLVDNQHSWPFRNAVDREKLPRYYEIIQKPMDLDTMRRKLESNEYQNLKSFVADACLIFDNTRQFYVKQNEIYQCADQLEKVFRSEIVRVSKDVDGHRSRVPSVLDIETDQLLGFGSDCNMDPSQFLEGVL